MKRAEDPRLLAGSGCFVDDVRLPRALHLAILRSLHAHARIVRLDTSAARAMPGVAAALAGAEIAQLVPSLPVLWPCGNPKVLTRPTAAADVVRYVGEPVAVVVAANRYLAEDAAEAIEVEYEPLPVVASMEEALASDAPLLFPDWGENVIGTIEMGQPPSASQAACVVRERFSI